MKYFVILFIVNYFFRENLVNAAAYPQENVKLNNSTLDRPKRGLVDGNYDYLLTLAMGAMICMRPDVKPAVFDTDTNKRCKIDVTFLKHNHALILREDDHSEYMYPEDDHVIYFAPDDPVFLSCGHEGNHFLTEKLNNVRYKTFTCVCNQMFAADDSLYNFYELHCKDLPERSIVDKGIIYNNAEYHKYQIGFKTDSKPSFLHLIDVIFNDKTDTTYYVKSTISKHIIGGQAIKKKLIAPKNFDQRFCCNKFSMDKIYLESSQVNSLLSLLEGQKKLDDSKRYIVPNTDFTFNRGHLTPKTANVYLTGGAATFAYLNVAPQWAGINKANWAFIETHVISMVKQLKRDLIVYTGTYGNLYLKDVENDNQFKQIYLHAAKDSFIDAMRTPSLFFPISLLLALMRSVKKYLPIPKFFFKVIISQEHKAGVVFVTANNPYLDINNEEELSKYKICRKPFTEIKGVMMPKGWKPNNPKLGYSYMCSVKDFMLSTGFKPVEGESITVENVLHITLQNSKVTQARINEIVNLQESDNEMPGTSGHKIVHEDP